MTEHAKPVPTPLRLLVPDEREDRVENDRRVAEALREVAAAVNSNSDAIYRLDSNVTLVREGHANLAELVRAMMSFLSGGKGPVAPPIPPMREELPSGVHDLVEAAVALKHAGEDDKRPVTSERVRAMFRAETKRMRLEASASRWDRTMALFPAMGRKTLWLVVGAAVMYGLHLLHLLGK